MAVHPTTSQEPEPGTKHTTAAPSSSVTVGNVTRRWDEEKGFVSTALLFCVTKLFHELIRQRLLTMSHLKGT